MVSIPSIVAPVITAEPGNTTSEYKLSLLTKGLMVLVPLVVALLHTVGYDVPSGVTTSVYAAVVPALALEQAAYTLGRSLRKRGTQG